MPCQEAADALKAACLEIHDAAVRYRLADGIIGLLFLPLHVKLQDIKSLFWYCGLNSTFFRAKCVELT